MAKTRSIISISGKLGDKVFVSGGKNKDYVREAPKAKLTKKQLAVLQKNSNRTAALNLLASDIKTIIHSYCGIFMQSNLYQEIQKRFKKEQLDNRYLLLRQLKDMKVNSRYPFHEIGHCIINKMEAVKNKIIITLEVLAHPRQPGRHKIDGYYFEAILLTWSKSDKKAKHSCQRTDWLSTAGKRGVFEFEFPKAAGIINWLLCLQIKLGANEDEIVDFPYHRMQITDAGTCSKEDEKILKKKMEDEQKDGEKKRIKKQEDNRPRVKPLKWL